MPDQDIKIAVSENYNGEDVIPNLIETARNLLETDVDQSKDFFEKALIISRNNNYNSGIGDCLLELGKIQKLKVDSIGAYKLIHEAVDYFSKTKAYHKLFECFTLLADIYYQIGNYGQALEACLKSLGQLKKTDKSEIRGNVYNKIGNIYVALGEYEKAIEQHVMALEVFDALQNKPKISETLHYIGSCYKRLGKHDQAFEFLDKSLTIADEINDPALQVKPTGSLAILFSKLKQSDRATDFFYRAIDFVNITGDLLPKAELLLNLGDLYKDNLQFEQAVKALQEALGIAESLKARNPLHLIHKCMAETYELSGDYTNALLHFKKYSLISSELMNEQVSLKSKGIQLKYDFEEARKEKALAEKAVLLKDQFIANISHEIRTPLNGVLGMADLLADTNPTPEQMEYINTIRLSANNLILIINDILDFSKIQSGDITIEKAEFRFRTVIEDITRLLKPHAEEKRITLSFKTDEQIPETLIGDEVRLKQVLMNILNNSVKFTETGNIKLDAQLTQVADKKIKILFTITDTGIGIDDEKINSIFESFGQLGSDNTKTSGGAGLGLAIVKQLVDLQGGSISVNSKIGSGTVFKVELPFRITKPIQQFSGPGKTSGTNVPKDLSEVCILLVEDNKVNQFLAQKLLSKMGFVVVIANNGNEAIQFLKTRKFNLILMDVQMPEMNGYELTEVVRNTLPEPVNLIPIIALTAYASAQEKEKALSIGMSDYITKPYSPHELMTSIMKQVNLPGKSDVTTAGNDVAASIDPATIRQTSEKLLQLFSGNVNDVMSLLHMLIGQIPILLKEADQHISSKSWPALFQTVHKLKSSVNLLKVNTLVNLVAEVEELSRDQMHTDRIPGIFNNLKKACEVAVSLLKEETIRLKKIDQPK